MKKVNLYIFLVILLSLIALDLFWGGVDFSFEDLIFRLRVYRISTAFMAGGSLAICFELLEFPDSRIFFRSM